jgi:outer membrane protein
VRGNCKKLLLMLALLFYMATSVHGALAAAIPADRPLALDEAVSLALGTHPRIKGSEQDLDAARFVTKQAVSAFWPQVGFETSRDYIHSARKIRVGGTGITTTADYVANNFNFNTDWMLFDFGRTYYNVKGLAALEDSLLNDLSAAQQQVAYDVMNAYFGLLKAQSLVKVSQETLDAANLHLKQARSFFDVGVKPQYDVTSAEVQVNDANVTLIQADDAVKAARIVLNTKIGLAPLTPTTVFDPPALEDLKKPMDEYYQDAVNNRPEIRSLEAKIKSSEMSVKGAVANYLPTVSASAVMNWYKEDHSDALDNENFQLTLDFPLFTGFRTEAQVGQARANALSTKYRLEDLKLAVLSDVSQSYIAVEDAKARFVALESSVRKARENLDIAQGRYEAGVGQIIDVTDAQVSLTKAETDYATAKYDYHTAYTNLLKSIGKSVK